MDTVRTSHALLKHLFLLLRAHFSLRIFPLKYLPGVFTQIYIRLFINITQGNLSLKIQKFRKQRRGGRKREMMSRHQLTSSSLVQAHRHHIGIQSSPVGDHHPPQI
jgi:hypothetical protein